MSEKIKHADDIIHANDIAQQAAKAAATAAKTARLAYDPEEQRKLAAIKCCQGLGCCAIQIGLLQYECVMTCAACWMCCAWCESLDFKYSNSDRVENCCCKQLWGCPQYHEAYTHYKTSVACSPNMQQMRRENAKKDE